MSYLEYLRQAESQTNTLNGEQAYNSTGSYLLDLFSVIGSSRNSYDIEKKIFKAFTEDSLLASKMAFYTRDIYSGLGERKTGRTFFKVMANHYPSILKKYLELIPEFGRWDDLIELLDTPLKEDVIEIIKKQLNQDIEDSKNQKPISLLAKWLPSINTSSDISKHNAHILAESLKLSKKSYRKTLSNLRSYLNIIEKNITSKNYSSIIYSQVPSYAMKKYRNAFYRNDEEQFKKYLEDVKSNKKTIKAKTLYPYDIVEQYLYGTHSKDDVLESQWDNLPKYISNENSFLIMADVSGSMHGRPLAISISLAIYFAVRNKGPYKNKFMNFSSNPHLLDIKGTTLFEMIHSIDMHDWEMNTNIEAAFDLVLNTAIKNKCKQEELPTHIIIISDMEFDSCTHRNKYGFYDEMKHRFETNGYKIPVVVFWNVNSLKNTFHASSLTDGVILTSGASPSVFKTLVEAKNIDPYSYMLSVLNNERYNKIN